MAALEEYVFVGAKRSAWWEDMWVKAFCPEWWLDVPTVPSRQVATAFVNDLPSLRPLDRGFL